MILHPGILALLLGALLSLLLLTLALPEVWAVLRRWRPESCSEQQLRLERRTSLVSTLVAYAAGFQLVGLLLFVYATDSLHGQFVGAMCATGTLNANPVGWNLLPLKLILFFLAAFWLALNGLIRRAPDYPLMRTVYALLPLLWLLVLLDFVLQLDFFTGLQPQIITSCCGSLFSTAGSGVAGSLGGLPVRLLMVLFYGWSLLLVGLLLAMLRFRAGWLRGAAVLAAAVFLPLSLAATIAFIAVYIYQLPGHHCPFDLLQAGYHWIGYPLYFGLFGGGFFAMLPGMGRLLCRIPSLRPLVEATERRWILLALAGIGLFLLLATWPVATGPFRLLTFI
ncbi:hypothetical protein EDC39_11137 [Geothermobacter ehrlichii]|uniref:Uncharacterized protein n=1 Tax=Geothermobacter ehrlichii TaxID=213224 RepID=A0A5D3WI08_9BACT|nr:hypothetical protein [Geothermobacter ehrlichii]TYO97107.1 hypothetical protein EDC39_11137 [Geothermobacter ehrlichii]